MAEMSANELMEAFIRLKVIGRDDLKRALKEAEADVAKFERTQAEKARQPFVQRAMGALSGGGDSGTRAIAALGAGGAVAAALVTATNALVDAVGKFGEFQRRNIDIRQNAAQASANIATDAQREIAARMGAPMFVPESQQASANVRREALQKLADERTERQRVANDWRSRALMVMRGDVTGAMFAGVNAMEADRAYAAGVRQLETQRMRDAGRLRTADVLRYQDEMAQAAQQFTHFTVMGPR